MKLAAAKRSSSTSAASARRKAATKRNGAAVATVLDKFRRRTRVRKAARLFLLERFESLVACVPAALAGDPEAGIHAMRVEAKRLREALRLFRRAYRRDSFDHLLAEIETLNDRLGAVRDADVLDAHLADLPGVAETEELTPLRAELASQRERDLTTFHTALGELAASDFEARFRDLIINGRHRIDHKVAGRKLSWFAPREVGRRLRRVLKRIRAVSGEFDVHGLHEVRIANKQLRYAMETFASIYDRRFQRALDAVVELHSRLGDVHDLDVLIERLDQWTAEHGPTEDLTAQLEALRTRRAKAYARAERWLTREGARSFGHTVMDTLD